MITDDPEVKEALRKVSVTFDAMNKARGKYNRCRRDDSREKARAERVAAERAYQVAADERDRICDIARARATQRGDYPLRSHDGPAIDFDKPFDFVDTLDLCTERLKKEIE